MGQSAIQAVLETYFPGWEAPEDDGKTWTSCLCPFHLEARPSAAISYELDAVKCQACSFGGDLVGIVRFMMSQELGEEAPFGDAVRKTESILVGAGADIPESFARLTGGRVPARKRALGRQAGKPGGRLRTRPAPGT